MNGTNWLEPSKLVAHLSRMHVCKLEFGIAAFVDYPGLEPSCLILEIVPSRESYT